MYDPYAEFKKYILPNGLEVHYAHTDRPWIIVEIVVHSGGREDPVELPGLAHFVEHLVSENIPNRGLDHVSEFFDTCGGSTGFGRTNYLSTRYKFCVPADVSILREALNIFGSMLLGARIKKKIERERKIIQCEFNERYLFPEKLDWETTAHRSLFNGHRLETWFGPLGKSEGFLSATKADLQVFYDRHYTPANMSVVIHGGLSTREVIALLEKSEFGMRKEGIRNQIPVPFNPISIPLERERVVKLSNHTSLRIDQTQYEATWAFPVDYPQLARSVFDQMLNMILFEEIREKRRFAYSVHANYIDYQDVSEYQITANVATGATSRIDRCIQECISMVPSRFDLFTRNIESLKRNCHMIDLSGSDLVETASDDLVAQHRIISSQEDWGGLHQVKFEQMAEAAALLSDERKYTFVIRP